MRFIRRFQSIEVALCICFVLALCNSSHAQSSFECQKPLPDSAKDKILSDVDERYQGLNQLEANFIQDSYFVGLATERTSSGKVYFKKPGQMDWIYESPESQRFVSNGNTFWFYQPELKQVTITDFKQSFQSDLPVSFLLGVGQLRRDFTVDKYCESSEGIVLELAPIGDDTTLSKFTLLVAKGSLTPMGARVLDVGGNETSIKFQSISFNSIIDPKRFDFQIPKGVDILDQRQDAAVSRIGNPQESKGPSSSKEKPPTPSNQK